jgi:hypothetical protein
VERVSWQTLNIQAAAAFLRERIASGDDSPRTKLIYEGLLEVLNPTRRATRVQREMAASARGAAAAAVKAERDRRNAERRRQTDRRKVNLGNLSAKERRADVDRRTASDRRNRS